MFQAGQLSLRQQLQVLWLLLAVSMAATAVHAEWHDSYDFAGKGVIAFWPLDGDALDRSGQGNDGAWLGSATFSSGRFGQGHSLSPGSYMEVAPPAALADYSAITISAWYKTMTVPSDNESLLGIGIDGVGYSHSYLFVLGGGSVAGATFNSWGTAGGLGTPNLDSAQVFDGSWHLLTATWDGAVSRIYVDSTLVAENPAAVGSVSPQGGEPFFINRHNWSWGSSSRLTGTVDEAVVFDHALSATEVALLASDADEDGVADYWTADSSLQIVFSRGLPPHVHPWISNLDGSAARELADVDIASYPRLSHGNVIFMAEDYLGQGSGIYLISTAPGSVPVKIPNTDDIRTPNGPNWDAIDISPDGTRMVWAAPEPGDYYQNHNLYVAGVDGSGKVRVARDTSKHYFSVNWGESDRITFARSWVGDAYSQRIHSMRPDGSEVTQVISDFAQYLHIGGPAGRAAVTWGQPGEPPLATMDNDFGDFQFVPGPLHGYSFTSWHPFEDRLFGARHGGLYSIDRASGTEVLLISSSGGYVLGGDVGSGSTGNLPPSASAGPDQTLQAGPDCLASVTLDGSGSTDPEGAELDYVWTWSGPSLSGPRPTLQLPLGDHPFSLQVLDPHGASDSDEASIAVLDQSPPEATLSAAPDALWPPDHRMIEVQVLSPATDNCSSSPTCAIADVLSSEPTTGPGADFEIVDAESVRLRAARLGSGPGRIYTVLVRCEDGNGNESIATVDVTVSSAPVVLSASADTFLRQGAADTNEGGNDSLRLQSSGKNRGLVAFDLSGLSLGGVTSATLALTVSDVADNWGATGRPVRAHRLAATWAEGDGWTVGGNSRGTGPGATWNCATDSQISNQQTNCVGAPWSGGTFDAAGGPPVTHFNGMTGVVSFNVSADIAPGAPFGWLIKKENEAQNGKIFYYSREGAALAGVPQLSPRLILQFD